MKVVALPGIRFECGYRAIATRDFAGMDLVGLPQTFRQVFVEITGGVGEGGEDQHLPVARIDRRSQLAIDLGFKVLKLGIISRCDLEHFGEECVDHHKIS